MARSTKIYLVYVEGESMPSAAFTVKHEALHYIETELSPIPRRGILLYSASDGARDGKGWQRLPL